MTNPIGPPTKASALDNALVAFVHKVVAAVANVILPVKTATITSLADIVEASAQVCDRRSKAVHTAETTEGAGVFADRGTHDFSVETAASSYALQSTKANHSPR